MQGVSAAPLQCCLAAMPVAMQPDTAHAQPSCPDTLVLLAVARCLMPWLPQLLKKPYSAFTFGALAWQLSHPSLKLQACMSAAGAVWVMCKR